MVATFKRTFMNVGFAVIAYLVLTTLTQVVFQNYVRENHNADVNDIREELSAVIEEAYRLFDGAERVQFERRSNAMMCSTDTINWLRTVSARSSVFAKIGLTESDKLMCDSLTGNIAQAWPESQREFGISEGFMTLTGVRDDLFDQTPTLIFKGARLSVLVNPGAVVESNDAQAISVFTSDSDQPTVLFGSDPILLPAFSFYPFSELYGNVTCLNDLAVCIQTVQTRAQLWADYYWVIYAKICIDLLLLVLAFLAVGRFRRYRLSDRQRVKRALAKRQHFYFSAQPIVDLATKKTSAYEILTRFEDPDGVLTPDRAIPQVRALHQTHEYSFWMIETVLNQPFIQSLPKDVLLHFNLFPDDLPTFDVDRLKRVIDQSGVDVTVCVEITEDFDFNVDTCLDQLHKFDALGIPVSIDDFGTGYSNLGKLSKLPIHTLKIDQSFIKDMEKDGVRASLIPEIIAIARRLGVEIIAEGVEQPEQAEMLREMGVHMGQGWYFGRPQRVGRDNLSSTDAKSVGHSLATDYNSP